MPYPDTEKHDVNMADPLGTSIERGQGETMSTDSYIQKQLINIARKTKVGRKLFPKETGGRNIFPKESEIPLAKETGITIPVPVDQGFQGFNGPSVGSESGLILNLGSPGILQARLWIWTQTVAASIFIFGPT